MAPRDIFLVQTVGLVEADRDLALKRRKEIT